MANDDVVWVDVLPSLDKLVPELRKGLSKVAPKAGQQAGREYSDGFRQAAVSGVEKASAQIATARKKEADAAGAVRIAEAKLAEMRDSGKAKASQLVAAEEGLAKAKRTLESSTDAVARNTRQLATEQERAARESKALSKGLADVGDTADSAGRKAGGFGSGLVSSLKLAGGALLAGGLVQGLKGIVGLSSDAQQSIGGVEAVFKGYADSVKDRSKEAAQALGLSGNAYRELATVIGSQLKNAGVPMDQLGGATDKLIAQGADLSAMFGGTTQEAVDALSSALKGEMDPIERYGISLNDAALKAEALSLGVYSGAGNLDANAKAMAVMSLVTKQGADAQGAFGRESDTAAGRAARASAQWENLKTTLGNGLLPVWSNLMGFVGSTVLPGLSSVGDAFGQLYGILFKGDFTGGPFAEDSKFVDILFRIRDGFQVISEFVRDNLTPILVGVGAGFAVFAGPAVLGAIGSLASIIGGALVSAFGFLLSPVALTLAAIGGIVAVFTAAYRESQPLRDAIDKLKSSFGVFLDAFKDADAEGGIGGFFTRVGAGITAALPVVQDALADAGRALVDWIEPRIAPALTAIGGWLAAIGGWVWGTGLPWLVGALAGLGQALIDWIEPQIMPALTAISGWLAALAGWVWSTGLPWLLDALGGLAQALIDWIGPQIPGMLAAIGGFLGGLVDWVWSTGLPWLLDALGGLAQALIDWITPQIPGLLSKLGEFLGSALGWLLGTGLPLLVGGLLYLAYELISWVLPQLPGLLGNLVKFFAGVVSWLVTDGLPMVAKGLYNLASSAISSFWTALSDSPLFTKLGEIFGRAVDIVGRTWDALKERVKDPIRIVFEFVNDNMITPVNKILKVFPGDLAIPPLPRLASGGLLRGPGTGTSDSILGVDPVSGVPTAAVSNGEYVVKQSRVKQVGVAFMDAFNAGQLPFLSGGGLAGRYGVPGLEGGGVVGFLSGLVDKAKDAVSTVKNFATDMLAKGARKAAELVLGPIRDAAKSMIPNKVPLNLLSSGVDMLYNAVLGKGDEQDKLTQLSNATFGRGKPTPNGVGGLGPAAAAARAFVMKTFGLTNIGGYAKRNIAGTGTVSDHALGKAIDVMIPNYKSPAGIAKGNAVANYFVNNPDAFGTKYVIWKSQINSGSGWKPYGHPGGGRSDTLQHEDHPHISLYDQGGLVPPGYHQIFNGTGGMERMLTPPQDDYFRRFVNVTSQHGGNERTTNINVTANWNEQSIARAVDQRLQERDALASVWP